MFLFSEPSPGWLKRQLICLFSYDFLRFILVYGLCLKYIWYRCLFPSTMNLSFHVNTPLKMPGHQLCRGARGELIGATYGNRSANDEAQNMVWLFKTGISARTPTKWNVILVVTAQISFFTQVLPLVIRFTSFVDPTHWPISCTLGKLVHGHF